MFRDRGAVIIAPQCVLLLVLAAACQSSQRREDQSASDAERRAQVTGKATFRGDVSLPDDAVFEALLQDVSRLDAPATVIGKAVIEDVSGREVVFAIPYDSALINPRRNYAVRARVLDDDDVIWVADRAHPILTQGTGTRANVVMRRVGRSEHTGPDGGDILLAGELTYLSDVARLTECRSGRVYPVSKEGDFADMRAAYTKLARALGAPLYVTFEGLIVERQLTTGSGRTPTVVVSDFVEGWPSLSCVTSDEDLPLLNTRWHITRVAGTRTADVTGFEEPVLQLISSADSLSYAATVGCNGISGSVTVTGDEIAFGSATGTVKSCGAPLDSLERRLVDALQQVVHWQVLGSTLEFENSNGETVAVFEYRRRP